MLALIVEGAMHILGITTAIVLAHIVIKFFGL